MTRSSLLLETLGVRWRVDTSALDEPQAARLAELWDRAVIEDDGAPAMDFTILPSGSVQPPLAAPEAVVTEDFDRFPYVFSRALTLASIDHQRGQLLMFHAAGLASPDGQSALVLYAASGTGKSTAARTLATTWGYLTDETVGITSDLRVLPHPKPISMIPVGAPPGTKEEFSPDELALQATPPAARVAAVVGLRREPEHTPATLVAIDLIEGLAAALSQTSSTALVPQPLHRLSEVLTQGGGPWLLEYTEIEEGLTLLRQLIERPEGLIDPTDSVTWTHIPPPPKRRLDAVVHHDLSTTAPTVDTTTGGPTGTSDETLLEAYGDQDTVVRAPWTDAVHSDGAVLVLRDNVPAQLRGLGALVWLLAEEPITLAEVTAQAIARHGPSEGAGIAIRAAVALLVGNGILERVHNLTGKNT
ncbi:MAG: hypothetical protein ACK5MP_12410 [Nostocoides sp.]